MTCFLCGCDDGHHLGCMAGITPRLTPELAVRMGLLAPPAGEKVIPDSVVEVLREGSTTTVPEAQANACAVDGCDNPKYSDSPRAKYCEEHKDPKNRKE